LGRFSLFNNHDPDRPSIDAQRDKVDLGAGFFFAWPWKPDILALNYRYREVTGCLSAFGPVAWFD
jgi:hypothetical protein